MMKLQFSIYSKFSIQYSVCGSLVDDEQRCLSSKWNERNFSLSFFQLKLKDLSVFIYLSVIKF